jgi:hypothetical protein
MVYPTRKVFRELNCNRNVVIEIQEEKKPGTDGTVLYTARGKRDLRRH